MLGGNGRVAHWALRAARTARSAKARPAGLVGAWTMRASRMVPLLSVVIVSRAVKLAKSLAPVSPVQHSRMRSPIAPRACALSCAFSAPAGEPPPGAPPRGGLAAAVRDGSLCACCRRSRSSVLSSALLSAGAFVGLGWLLALGTGDGAGGTGTGGVGAGRGGGDGAGGGGTAAAARAQALRRGAAVVARERAAGGQAVPGEPGAAEPEAATATVPGPA